MASYLAANAVWVNYGALWLLVPGRLNTQTFVIDPLSDSEWNDCIHERLMTDRSNPYPTLKDLKYVQAFSALVLKYRRNVLLM